MFAISFVGRAAQFNRRRPRERNRLNAARAAANVRFLCRFLDAGKNEALGTLS
jgi:hypothetical protein